MAINWSDHISNGWCADESFSGEFSNWRQANDPTQCANSSVGYGTFWFAPVPQAQALHAATQSSQQLDFYADSTALFYLGMTAVVTLWAMKAFVLKFIYAS